MKGQLIDWGKNIQGTYTGKDLPPSYRLKIPQWEMREKRYYSNIAKKNTADILY